MTSPQFKLLNQYSLLVETKSGTRLNWSGQGGNLVVPCSEPVQALYIGHYINPYLSDGKFFHFLEFPVKKEVFLHKLKEGSFFSLDDKIVNVPSRFNNPVETTRCENYEDYVGRFYGSQNDIQKYLRVMKLAMERLR